MSSEMPPPRRDSEAIQILATEHWSLLATRALTYQESLGRVNMFLAILSGAVIALALIAQADRFGTTFIAVAVFMLSVADPAFHQGRPRQRSLRAAASEHARQDRAGVHD